MKIKKGDTILIISGKDRGKTGKILDVFPKEERIVVEGANLKKRHVKPKKSDQKGQIVEVPAAFSAAKAKLICQKCGKPTKLGYRFEGNKKYRVCKKCNSEI